MSHVARSIVVSHTLYMHRVYDSKSKNTRERQYRHLKISRLRFVDISVFETLSIFCKFVCYRAAIACRLRQISNNAHRHRWYKCNTIWCDTNKRTPRTNRRGKRRHESLLLLSHCLSAGIRAFALHFIAGNWLTPLCVHPASFVITHVVLRARLRARSVCAKTASNLSTLCYSRPIADSETAADCRRAKIATSFARLVHYFRMTDIEKNR